MNWLVVRHKVKDYAVWKPYFDADLPRQLAAGMHIMAIGRNVDDPSELFLVFTVEDVAQAKAFGQDPGLKDVMEQAGVLDQPDFMLMETVESKMGKPEGAEGASPDLTGTLWLIVHLKVQDFATFPLNFHANEPMRQAAGLHFMELDRSVDDPNEVFVILQAEDLAKAKAFTASEELKGAMAQAGVLERKFHLMETVASYPMRK